MDLAILRLRKDRFSSLLRTQPSGCIYWSGHRAGTGREARLTIWHENRIHQTSVRLAAFMLHHNRQLEPNEFVYPSCKDPLCLSPEHLVVGIFGKLAKERSEIHTRNVALRALGRREKRLDKEAELHNKKLVRMGKKCHLVADNPEEFPDTYKCYKCKVIKNREEFGYWQRPDLHYEMLKDCLICNRAYQKRQTRIRVGSTWEGYLTRVRQSAKYGAKRRGMEFDLPVQYLKTLLLVQDYRCALSGTELQLAVATDTHKTRPASPSLDRINSDLGYIKGNVRFVCLCLNMALNRWGERSVLPILEAMVSYSAPDRGRFEVNQ